ncbi:MAG: autotransporter strand-loop-strand O-heptosyltransferase [Schwartzia succinivorans]|nr:autotransporter strand-loop-strand O-heptosyltransferase [Schwartzia succinivorans]
MGGFRYPVDYFSCKDFDKKPEDIQQMLMCMADWGRKLSGPVRGETGIDGVRLDFNNGVRVEIPDGLWHVTIGDYDSGMVFYDADVSEKLIVSMEKYYIHWHIRISYEGNLVFEHVFDMRGQKVRLIFQSWLLGDMQSFLSYVPYVRDYYGADVYYWIPDSMKEAAQRILKDVPLREDFDEDTYATFYFNAGLDIPCLMPIDGRQVPMTQTGQIIMNLPSEAPKLPWPKGERKIKEPYVCIGVQASSVGKGWLYPHGWDEVTEYLKSLGYRVLCIDKEKVMDDRGYRLEMPEGAEDYTGDLPLIERLDMLTYADFFIGLASGLSWLAYTADCPVVMIGGFSAYWTEFPNPYRVYNRLVCNACYNDVRVNWQGNMCPKQQAGTDKIFECSKKISPRMVLDAIERLRRDKGLV